MCTKLILSSPFDALWRDCDAFAAVARLSGEEFRRVKSRRTFRFEVENRGYFAKVHHGVGWREIWKNWFQLKAPVLGAANEFYALELLARLGVDTMTPVAFGEKHWNPARRESFLVTEELTDCVSLEDYCRDWRPSFREKTALLTVLAQTAAAMHDHGLNHRDCYLCHFLLDRKRWQEGRGEAHLHVIDLHRAQIRRRIPYRYRVKDVAGLFFSSMDAGLTRHDLFRFMRIYSHGQWRGQMRFWRDVERTAVKLYCKEFKRDPVMYG